MEKERASGIPVGNKENVGYQNGVPVFKPYAHGTKTLSVMSKIIQKEVEKQKWDTEKSKS